MKVKTQFLAYSCSDQASPMVQPWERFSGYRGEEEQPGKGDG